MTEQAAIENKPRVKLWAPQTAYDGWRASVSDLSGGWVRVPHYATDGHGASFACAFDSRAQALKAARSFWLRHFKSAPVRPWLHDREHEDAALAAIAEREGKAA